MDSKKIFGIILILLLIPLASAGFFGWFKETITGKASSQPTNLSIAVSGTSPAQVTFVDNHTLTAITPNEFPSETEIKFNVTVRDPDGVADINTTATIVNISIESAVRRNLSCVYLGVVDAYSANFSCTVNMQYWDRNSDNWTIVAAAKDLGAGTYQYNNSMRFRYGLTKAMVISPSALTWATVTPGQTNRDSSNDPTVVNNTGNYNGTIQITAIDLGGESNGAQTIPANNFTINRTGATECAAVENRMVNNSATTVLGTKSNPGNLSAGAGAGQENLYYCIPLVPQISSQTYSTLKGGSWTILYP